MNAKENIEESTLIGAAVDANYLQQHHDGDALEYSSSSSNIDSPILEEDDEGFTVVTTTTTSSNIVSSNKDDEPIIEVIQQVLEDSIEKAMHTSSIAATDKVEIEEPQESSLVSSISTTTSTDIDSVDVTLEDIEEEEQEVKYAMNHHQYQQEQQKQQWYASLVPNNPKFNLFANTAFIATVSILCMTLNYSLSTTCKLQN
jgi:hypothetical protein